MILGYNFDFKNVFELQKMLFYFFQVKKTSLKNINYIFFIKIIIYNFLIDDLYSQFHKQRINKSMSK